MKERPGGISSEATGRAAPQSDKDYEQWREAKGSATPVSKIHAPEGFEVELLRSAPPSEGSWIALTFDPKGRVYVAVESGGILRMTLGDTPSNGGGPAVSVERVDDTLVECRGLLWAHGGLYAQCNVATPVRPSGLYRIRGPDGDDRFDEVTLLRPVPGGGHGLNELTLGPDGLIYLIQGDQSGLPPDWQIHQTLVKHSGLDQLTDVNGRPHVYRPQPPMEGRLIRTDAEGKLWEVVASGMRNPMGIDFNAQGEAFTYEADMELDVGLPWYRPTHLIHLVSGADYGWRQGADPWPMDAPDRPPVSAVIGLGSPTAVKFGTRSGFPPRYRDALFVLDWAYGRILAVSMTAEGASYRCRWEPFLDGRPLNVTDLEFGPDGAMYFLTGGRGTQSGLYRVRYAGPRVHTAPPDEEERARMRLAGEARALRHRLEAFHGDPNPAAIEAAWPHLGSSDPWIRHAARIAVEHQPVSGWLDRALAERDAAAAVNVWLAVARVADPSVQVALMDRLNALEWAALTDEQRVTAMRVYELCFHRMGRPAPDLVAAALEKLRVGYPATPGAANRAQSRLLVYLEADDIVARTNPLIAATVSQEEKLYYLNVLRPVREGWSAREVELYFESLGRLRAMPGGRQYPGFVGGLIRDSLDKLPEDLKPVAMRALQPASFVEDPKAATIEPRPFVRAWALGDLERELPLGDHGRDYEQGRRLFAEGGCIQCHRMGSEGGATGPDLTQVASRFNRRDILRSILEPSAAIDEKYKIAIIVADDGRHHMGYVLQEDDESVTLTPDPSGSTPEKIEKSRIDSREWMPFSPMPAGLLDTMTAKQVLDLLVYVESGGNRADPAFGSE